jgi:hypothetical protein
MRRKREYDFSVQRLNRATGPGFALILALGLLGLMLSTTAGAQINGMPASVTSPGFGGRQVNGVPPSVTSLGPRGYTPSSPVCCFTGTSLGKPHFVANPNSTPNFHHHHRNGYLPWGGVYAVPYYGYYDSGDDVANDPAGEPYNGGPTIFDRRGSGAPPPASPPYPSRARTDSPQAEAASDAAAQPEAAPATDQPQTVLVFKDGHQVEVANYAIVGSTLYDLSSGHRQKIALADLDLTATAKQNDDRGIDFRVPGASEAN